MVTITVLVEGGSPAVLWNSGPYGFFEFVIITVTTVSAGWYPRVEVGDAVPGKHTPSGQAEFTLLEGPSVIAAGTSVAP